MEISVTVLIYNSQDYLSDALCSLQSQTFKDFEVILFDDHSTDESLSICQSFIEIDSRFKYFKPPKHLGLQASRQAALEQCKGKYVAVLDSDDISETTRLEKQLSILKSQSDVVLVATLCSQIDENGNKSSKPDAPPLDPVGILWRLIFGNPISHSSVIFPREMALEVGGYDPKKTTCEDADFYGRLLCRGRVYCLPEVLTYRRMHNKNISKGIDSYKIKRSSVLEVFQKLIERFLNISLNLDTVEALYIHSQKATINSSYFLKALEVLKEARSVFEKNYKNENESFTIFRENLLFLLDLKKKNEKELWWNDTFNLWQKTLNELLKEGAKRKYYWFIDSHLFFPYRQLSLKTLPSLIRAETKNLRNP